MNSNELKRLGFEPAVVNRGIVIWLLFLGIVLAISLSRDTGVLFPTIYLGASIAIYGLMCAYYHASKRQQVAKRALMLFFSEFGGGF
jgi:membrane associated rhomboid family serine protease